MVYFWYNFFMKTTLKKFGSNSQAVVIPKAIAELFHFSTSTEATFEPKQGELIIRVKSDKAMKLDTAIQDTDQQYGDLFKRLADQ